MSARLAVKTSLSRRRPGQASKQYGAAPTPNSDSPGPAECGIGPELSESIGFLICDAARYVKRTLAARLSQYGIPGGCWFLLRALWLRDGISQRELSVMLGVAEPGVVISLRAMERLGLVLRERDEADRRRMRVLLTPHARAMERELLAMAQEVNREVMSPFRPEDRAALVASLQALRMRMPAGEKLVPSEEDEDEIPPAARASASPQPGRRARRPAAGA